MRSPTRNGLSSMRRIVCSRTSVVNRSHQPFAGLLIDCEEDRTLRAVLVGMLREGDRGLIGAPGASAARRAVEARIL
jgi:hypothetical protein